MQLDLEDTIKNITFKCSICKEFVTTESFTNVFTRSTALKGQHICLDLFCESCRKWTEIESSEF